MGDPYAWGLTPAQAQLLRIALETAWDMEDGLERVRQIMDRGASKAALTALAEAHARLQRPHGAPPSRFSTLTQVPSFPVVPHLKEKSVSVTATPVQRREAWLSLMSDMERSLLSTRESARTQTGRPNWGQPALGEWDATAWAAGQLLEALRKLQAPEVPVDDTLGQASLLDLPETCPHGARLGEECPDSPCAVEFPCPYCEERGSHAPTCKHAGSDSLPVSTGVEEPGDDRPRRLIDCTGDRWEELGDGRWAYVLQGAEGKTAGQDPYDGTGRPFGPIFTLEELTRLYAPLREPEGDQYDHGAWPLDDPLEQDA